MPCTGPPVRILSGSSPNKSPERRRALRPVTLIRLQNEIRPASMALPGRALPSPATPVPPSPTTATALPQTTPRDMFGLLPPASPLLSAPTRAPSRALRVMPRPSQECPEATVDPAHLCENSVDGLVRGRDGPSESLASGRLRAWRARGPRRRRAHNGHDAALDGLAGNERRVRVVALDRTPSFLVERCRLRTESLHYLGVNHTPRHRHRHRIARACLGLITPAVPLRLRALPSKVCDSGREWLHVATRSAQLTRNDPSHPPPGPSDPPGEHSCCCFAPPSACRPARRGRALVMRRA
ncbi:hypothetical protein C8Q77DRAFT_796342 [Trametes polyzona]|nr:hypothetical protein C8Q77DRAFT_796342 [Trametes polyzona]